MTDLISREAAIAWFFRPYSNEKYYSNLDVKRALKAIPAVDAVPVIRCRDCKHSIENAKHIDVACEWSSDPDFYCAAGERMDENDNAPTIDAIPVDRIMKSLTYLKRGRRNRRRDSG